jgi:hypothetical protein
MPNSTIPLSHCVLLKQLERGRKFEKTNLLNRSVKKKSNQSVHDIVGKNMKRKK